MSVPIALGVTAALAGLAALRAHQGSQSQPGQHRLIDLPYDMRDIVREGLFSLGMGSLKADMMMEANPILPITMQPMDLLWPRVRRSFPGVDRQGLPADLWTEDHWDYRGPPHVIQLHNFIRLLLPAQEDRQNPSRIGDRLLGGDAAPRWQQDLTARVWEDEDRDTEVVVGLQPRPTPTRAKVGTMEGAFNLPPAIFIEGDFFDGRHRLFAARMAGLSHFPVINLEEMKP
jgi:hypothetical protein